MTPEQDAKLRELIEAAQLADHEWCESPVNAASSALLQSVEDRIPEYVNTLLDDKDKEITALKSANEWDEERRNMLLTLLESYAHTHRQFYFPAITEFDTEDTDVRDDIKALWGIRRQIGELIGIPPLPKADS